MLRRNENSTSRAPQLEDPFLRQLVERGCARIDRELAHLAPHLAERVSRWMAQLSPTGTAADYFLQACMFPVLRLPLWAAKSFGADPNCEFLADVTFSTINGYYYIRLLDNLMDGHATVEVQILPATAFFHTEFQLAYQKHFWPTHAFWNAFRSAWLGGSEAVTRELSLDSVGAIEFQQVSVAKLSPATIPVSAVGYHFGAGERIRAWEEFTRALAGFSQLEDDLFDWHHDLRHAKPSYFLSQAMRRAGAQTVGEWIMREGFSQGIRTLQHQLVALRRLLPALDSPEAKSYLDFREVTLEDQQEKIGAAFKVLRDMADIMQQPGPATCG